MNPVDGLEITSAVHRLQPLKQTAVVMISANREKQKYWQKVAKDLGADGFLPKPFEAPDLINAIESAIAARRK